MIAFDTIKQIVSEAGEAESLDKELGVRQYTLQGGGGCWRVAGFYFQESDECRLVFEALHYEARNLCIVRVYRESPLETLFARKWSGTSEKLPFVLKEGATIFRACLPTKVSQACEAEARLNELKLSDEKLELVASALNPIPPPCDLDEISEA